MGLSNLTSSEFILLISFAFVLIYQLIRDFLEKEYYTFWSPMTIMSLTNLYYCIIGPILIIEGESGYGLIFRGIDHRPYLYVAWLSSFTAYLMFYLGFTVVKFTKLNNASVPITDNMLKKYAIGVFLFSISLSVLWLGPGFISKVQFYSKERDALQSSTSVWGGYLIQALLFYITAVLLSFVYYLKTKKIGLFLFFFAFTVALYINEGFRFRIVLLAYSLLSVYYLFTKTRVNLLYSILLLFGLVFVSGLMELTRSYGNGLNMDRVENVDASDILSNSTNESAVFLGSGFLFDKYDQVFDKSGSEFLINAIAAPIPRTIWPSKPDGSHMLKARDLYGGSYGAGQMFLWHTEYFMAYGWLGVVLFPFLLGILFKYIWVSYMNNKDCIIHIIAYSLSSSMIYVIVSRGYLSQQLTLFVILLIPSYYLITTHKST